MLRNLKHRGRKGSTTRKDAKKERSTPSDEHFDQESHIFTDHAKFIIIEKLEHQISAIADRKVLEKREDYWVSRLRTTSPKGFNDKWNLPIRTKIQRTCT